MDDLINGEKVPNSLLSELGTFTPLIKASIEINLT